MFPLFGLSQQRIALERAKRGGLAIKRRDRPILAHIVQDAFPVDMHDVPSPMSSGRRDNARERFSNWLAGATGSADGLRTLDDSVRSPQSCQRAPLWTTGDRSPVWIW